MPADDLYRLLYAKLPEGQYRIQESRHTDEPLSDWDAEDLVTLLRAKIYAEGFEPVVGPKIVRERASTGMPATTEHYVAALAIIRQRQGVIGDVARMR